MQKVFGKNKLKDSKSKKGGEGEQQEQQGDNSTEDTSSTSSSSGVTSTSPSDVVTEKLLAADLPENVSLADFTKIRTLGTGTFGRVYLVKHKATNKVFALKVLRKMEVVRLKQVDHIKNEKNILLELSHPFIVNMYATFQDDTNLYMLFEYVVGGEMFCHLRKSGRFPNDTARYYAAEVVLSLEYLHSKNVLYRDLKPENLLFDRTGNLKIVDFGFAKHVEDRTWTLCGTPEYLAPEIIQSKGHGKAVDWWALGVLIFEMLAGYPPFFDDNPFGVYEKILANRVHFPSHFDKEAKDLVRKLLASDRTRRLGNLKGGADDVKKHKWFKPVDWDALVEKKLGAPIAVNISSDDDASYFELYEEVPEEIVTVDPFRFIFKDF